MRIWLVPVMELCDQRVLGQHSEWHAIETLIRRNGSRWLRWHEHRHMEAFYDVHRRVVVEMELRGWTGHASPPRYLPTPHAVDLTNQEPYPVSDTDLFLNRAQLFARWGGQFRGRAQAEGSEVMWMAVEQMYRIDPHLYELDTRSQA